MSELAGVMASLKEAYDEPEMVDLLLSALPDVDPEDETNFHDLREWCLALKHIGGVTPKLSENLLKLAKQYAYRSR